MKYILNNKINPSYSAIEQVLTNRGVSIENIDKYINTTDADINDPKLLGEEKMRRGAEMVASAMVEKKKTLLVVDSDCDGFTSSALFLNYIGDINPEYADSIECFIHEGKQHGLVDAIEQIRKEGDYKFVVVIDAGTNDIKEQNELAEMGIDCLVLDHHLKESGATTPAIVINNHIGDYPNKDLAGVGVAWQFCRYLDSLNNSSYADGYLDLVALGLK